MIGETNEKACCFYVSKNHLVVILMSYLKRNLDKDKLYIFMEDDFDEEKEIILNKIEMPEEKEKILRKTWIKLDNVRRNKVIEKIVDNKLDGIVIVQGSVEYIKEINNKLKNNIKIKIINCYKFTDFEVNKKEILEYHGKIVNTKGECKISDIFKKKIEKKPILTK